MKKSFAKWLLGVEMEYLGKKELPRYYNTDDFYIANEKQLTTNEFISFLVKRLSKDEVPLKIKRCRGREVRLEFDTELVESAYGNYIINYFANIEDLKRFVAKNKLTLMSNNSGIMSYRNKKWIVNLQNNNQYRISDNDESIIVGHFKDKEIANEIARRLNENC